MRSRLELVHRGVQLGALIHGSLSLRGEERAIQQQHRRQIGADLGHHGAPALLLRVGRRAGGARRRGRLGRRGRIVDRIEEELVGAVRLPAPLRAEAEQVHAALAVEDLERGGLALDALGMQQVAALQRIAVARVGGQHGAAESGLGLKRRAALEHHDRARAAGPARRRAPYRGVPRAAASRSNRTARA